LHTAITSIPEGRRPHENYLITTLNAGQLFGALRNALKRGKRRLSLAAGGRHRERTQPEQ
jgi:hypothetical protein